MNLNYQLAIDAGLGEAVSLALRARQRDPTALNTSAISVALFLIPCVNGCIQTLTATRLESQKMSPFTPRKPASLRG